jgi:hypothetical protein
MYGTIISLVYRLDVLPWFQGNSRLANLSNGAVAVTIHQILIILATLKVLSVSLFHNIYIYKPYVLIFSILIYVVNIAWASKRFLIRNLKVGLNNVVRIHVSAFAASGIAAILILWKL